MAELEATCNSRITEVGVFLFLSALLIPGSVTALICTYGFLVWMLE